MNVDSPDLLATSSELRTIHRRHLAIACSVGPLIGLVATAFQYAITLVTQSGSHLAAIANGALWAEVAFCASCGGLAGFITQRYAVEAGGSGIPHVEAVLTHARPLRGLRVLMVKFIGGALAIGSKFSLGREGPTIHMGAAIAEEVTKRSKLPSHLREHVIACGAGAGLAAAFNAPLAGSLFIIEELRREVHSVTLGMALLTTVLADAVVRFFLGSAPIMTATNLLPPALETIPAVLAITLAGTLGGLLFNSTLIVTVTKLSFRGPLWLRGALIGSIVALCIHYMPTTTLDEKGAFNTFIDSAPGASTSVTILLALFGIKLLLTSVCYATGVPGGIFAPMLVQGAFIGVAIGKLMSLTGLGAPTDSVSALIGMTAFFAASVRAPFTGVVLLAEMTDGFHLMLPLMAAALVAYIVSERSGSRPIYERLQNKPSHSFFQK
jgi:CIC family chloride channel protein